MGHMMDNWDEIRTAFQVARLGTVSGAAEVLGVHHATVIRHIDALEKRLGTRLFQRHARGYTPTESGRDLLNVAQATAEQFGQLASRIKGQGESVTGELAAKAVRGVAPQLGQKALAATQPSLRTRAFWVGPLKTAASSAKPRELQGASSSAMRAE